MAVKYRTSYKSYDNSVWQVDISSDAHTGDVIDVRGHGNNACKISWDGGVDDPFDNPLVTSKAEIQLINEGQVNVDELQSAGDRDFVVEVFRGDILKWKGYMVVDQIQKPLLSTPYVVRITAIDGLNMLEGITYSHNNLPAPAGGASRCPLNYLRQCLFATSNLGLMLPIRWHIGLENTQTSDNPLSGQMTWSPFGEGFIAGEYTDGDGNTVTAYQNCRYIVEGIVKTFGCRIFQDNGAWHVMRTEDTIDGVFTYNECDATLGLPTITTHSVDINKLVAGRGENSDYKFIREDGTITMKSALGLVEVEYDADMRENAIPNGGFDHSSLAILLYWGYSDNPESAATMEIYDSLRQDNYGNSVLLTYPVTGDPAPDNRAIFTFNGGLPVDAHLLFKEFTWGFTFMPLNGFPYQPYNPVDPNDPNANIINWDANPLRVRVYYEALDRDGVMRTMYLNEFGYWQSEPAQGYLLQTAYNRSTGGGLVTHNITYTGFVKKGDVVRIFIDNSENIIPNILVEHVAEEAEEGNLTAVLNAVAAQINSASVTMTGTYNGQISFTINENFEHRVDPSVTSGGYTILPGNWLPVSVNKMKMGDIASVVFQGRGGNNEILFPDPGRLDWTTPEQSAETGVLYLEFAVLEGQRYALDDVWMRLADNKDVYRIEQPVQAGINTKQRFSLGISSSFSGFMVSNMMRSYHQSNEDFIWTDGTVEASLTEHYARSVMKWRYKPSRIFNGTINVRNADWGFFEVYQFSGLIGNYLPLRATYNTEMDEVEIVAMEGRDDGVITPEMVGHYGSSNLPINNRNGV